MNSQKEQNFFFCNHISMTDHFPAHHLVTTLNTTWSHYNSKHIKNKTYNSVNNQVSSN
jgi:hypothetical protein